MPDNPFFAITSFTIEDWNTGSFPYREFDVVKVPSGAASGQFLVSISDNNTGNGIPSGSGQNIGDWVNYQYSGLDFRGIWNPSFDSSINHEPRTNYIQFGDGYFQREANGVNHQQIILNATFQEIPDNEAKSLMSFFEYKGGVGKFKMTLPTPYGGEKLYVAKNWKHNFNGYNRNNIDTLFIEVFDQSFE